MTTPPIPAVLLASLSAASLYLLAQPELLVRFIRWKTIRSLKQMGFEMIGEVRPTAKTEKFARILALILAAYFLIFAFVLSQVRFHVAGRPVATHPSSI